MLTLLGRLIFFSAGCWHETGRFVTLIPNAPTMSYPETLIRSCLSQHDPRYISIMPSHLHSHLPSGLLPWEFSAELFCSFLFTSACCMPRRVANIQCNRANFKTLLPFKLLDAFRRRHRKPASGPRPSARRNSGQIESVWQISFKLGWIDVPLMF